MMTVEGRDALLRAVDTATDNLTDDELYMAVCFMHDMMVVRGFSFRDVCEESLESGYMMADDLGVSV